jgi:predicted phage-related endonuclease
MEKLGLKKVFVNVAMHHGNTTEPIALAEFEKRSGKRVASAGFISYRASPEEDDFIGGSPDGVILGSDDSVAAMDQAMLASGPADEALLQEVLKGGGVLEIKCPYASRPSYRKSPSEQTEKNARYMFQVQTMLEVMDLEYGELFVYAAASGHAPMIHRVRVQRDREFWAKVYGHTKEYWTSHFLPAKAYLASKNANGSLNQKLPIETPLQYKLRLEKMLKDQGLMPSQTLRDNGTRELVEWTKDILRKGEVIR